MICLMKHVHLKKMVGRAAVKYLFLMLLIVCHNNVLSQLRPGGLHVCNKKASYNAYIAQVFTRIGYQNYRTCCKRFIGICTKRCTRYRSNIVSYTNAVLQVRYTDTYFCCSGWARSGDQCPLPICNPGCQYGKCTSPGVCTCNQGYHGKLCENDDNECFSNPCSQVCNNLPGTYACGCNKGYQKVDSNPIASTCVDVNECATTPCKCAINTGGCATSCSNTIGSFSCSCNKGFQLTFDGKTCIDINECSSTALNQCQHKCHNTPGSYSCSCNTGYLLNTDRKTCADVNECDTLNGGCNQICVNKLGAYHCQCHTGYKLSYNVKTCADIDECAENTPCDNKHGTCTNIAGSYLCGCKAGFKLQDDRIICNDIDECASNLISGCSQNCHNNVGSYTCSCNVGYELNKNQRICDDMDECTENLHTCDHNCYNNVGSYTCICRPGYKLDADERTCVALPCETITGPLNGQIVCSGYVTNQHCNFTCDNGFFLVGSSTRFCLSSATWSGETAECRRQSCPTLNPPSDGSLVIPCIELFGSTCLVKCKNGYYLDGSQSSECVIRNEKATWLPNNATCKASLPCLPNPCRHGGKCIKLSDDKYFCDCSETGYTGLTCSTGKITIPNIPQLRVNQPSWFLKVLARPDDTLEIRPVYDASLLKFDPKKLIIYPAQTGAEFTITALQAGISTVQWNLAGINAQVFDKPMETTLYAFNDNNNDESIDITPDFYTKNCKEKRSNICGGKVSFFSSCVWRNKSPGFISVKGEDIILPLALTGLVTNDIVEYKSQEFIYPLKSIQDFLKSQELTDTCTGNNQWCNDINWNNKSLKYIAENSIFQRGYLDAFNKYLPFWLRVAVNMNNPYFEASNFLSGVSSGKNIKRIKQCKNLQIDESDDYSVYLPKISVEFSFLTTKKFSSSVDHQACLVINLCQKAVMIALPQNEKLKFDDELTEVGLNMNRVKVESFGVAKEETKCVILNDKIICAQTNSFWKILSSHQFNSKSSTFNLDGTLFTNSSTQTLLRKFDDKIELLYNGKIDFNIRISIFGGILTIQGVDSQVVGYGMLGGLASCPLCEHKGFKAVINIKSSDFQYESSRLRFIPASLSEIYIPFDMKGGSVQSIKNKNILLLRLRFYVGHVSTKIDELTSILLNRNYSGDAPILKRYGEQVISSIKSLQTNLKNSNSTVSNIFQQFQNFKNDIYDFMEQLQSLQKRYKNISQLELGTRVLLLQLKQIESLTLEVNDQHVQMTDQGQILSYKGSICLHQLCLEDADVAIYDLATDPLANLPCSRECAAKYKDLIEKDSMVIVATVKNEKSLTKRIMIKHGDGFRLILNRRKDIISGEMTASVKYFQTYHQTVFTFKDDVILFEVANVTFTNEISFLVSGKSDLLTTTWQSLVHSIQGISYNFANSLSNKTEKLYKDIATRTTRRLKSAADNVDSAQMAWKYAKDELAEAQKQARNASEQWRASDATYKRNLNLLQTTQIEFDSYLTNSDYLTNIITKDVQKVCQLETCMETCITIPVCDVCQDPMVVDVTRVKCEQQTETIRTSAERQFETTCDVTKFAFIPYYTGSCSRNPKSMARADAELKKSLVATGSAVGSMLGSVIPGVGTLLGGAIGAVVGFIGGLFSSCNESYEVYTKSWIENTPCTLLQTYVSTITRPFSVCFDTKEKIQTGFKIPYTCNCTVQNCITKIQDVTCLASNQICIKKRGLFINSTSNLPQKFMDVYKTLQQYKTNVQISLVKLASARQSNQHYQRELERIQNKVRLVEHSSLYVKRSYEDSNSILHFESCVMRSHRMSPEIKSLISIKKVRFNVELPLVNNIQLNVEISYRSLSKVIPFIYDFDNNDGANLKVAARKLIEQTLCKSSRKRRSTNSVEENLTFKPWHIDESLTSNIVRLACVTLQRATIFLKDSIQRLYNRTAKLIKLQNQVQEANNQSYLTITGPFVEDTNRQDGSTNLIKANQDVLTSAKRELSQIATQASTKNALQSWLVEAEVFTEMNNFSVCLGYQDCVEEAITTLGNLPEILKVPLVYYQQKLQNLHQKFNEIYEETSLKSLLLTVKKVQSSLFEIEKLTMHCSEPPQVTLVTAPNISIAEGEIVTMLCTCNSELPVKYYWMRNNQLIDGENSASLSFNATIKATGAYQCFARSLAGRGTTKETLVSVYRFPKFIEEPSSTIHLQPSDRDNIVMLTCNVTGHPNPSISWYYKSLLSVRKEFEKLNSTSALLETYTDGFYYCNSNNNFGKIKSKIARVDFLNAVPALSSCTIAFEVSLADARSILKFDNLLHTMMKETDLDNLKASGEVLINSSKIKIDIVVVPVQQQTVKEMLKLASTTRQAIANAIAVFVSTLLVEKSFLTTDNGTKIQVNNETLSYDYKLGQCEPGYKLHSNGFLCVQCPLGTAGKNCTLCEKNMFASKVAQKECSPCKDGKVTENVGSRTHQSCIELRRKKTDIVFVVDVSRRFHVNRLIENDIKSFITSFLQTYGDSNTIDLRYGLITYDGMAKKYVTLNDYKKLSDVTRALQLFKVRQFQKYSDTGLLAVEEMFKKDSSKDRKKIAIVITNGYSSRNRADEEFIKVRKQARQLQNNGVHVISLAFGDLIDNKEIKAISSNPKNKNTVIDENLQKTLKQIFTQSEAYLAGKCYFNDFDIAIMLRLKHYYGDSREYYADEAKLIESLVPVHRAFPNQRFYFLPRSRFYNLDGFSLLNKKTFLDELQRAHRRNQWSSGDIYERIKTALTVEITEDYGSISNMKILLILTNYALEKSNLKILAENNGGTLIFNVLLDKKTVKKRNLLVESTTDDDVIFGYHDYGLLINKMRDIQKESYCL